MGTRLASVLTVLHHENASSLGAHFTVAGEREPILWHDMYPVYDYNKLDEKSEAEHILFEVTTILCSTGEQSV